MFYNYKTFYLLSKYTFNFKTQTKTLFMYRTVLIEALISVKWLEIQAHQRVIRLDLRS